MPCGWQHFGLHVQPFPRRHPVSWQEPTKFFGGKCPSQLILCGLKQVRTLWYSELLLINMLFATEEKNKIKQKLGREDHFLSSLTPSLPVSSVAPVGALSPLLHAPPPKCISQELALTKLPFLPVTQEANRETASIMALLLSFTDTLAISCNPIQVLLGPTNLHSDCCGNLSDPSDLVNRGVGWKDEWRRAAKGLDLSCIFSSYPIFSSCKYRENVKMGPTS